METGTHKSTWIDKELDCDGQLEMVITSLGGSDWLTEDMTLDVVKHLVTVFQMSELQAAVEKYEESK